MQHRIKLIGAAIDACAGTKGAADTPDRLARNGWLKPLNLEFEKIIYYAGERNNIPKLESYFTDLAKTTRDTVAENKFPIVVGGDHSCAIGTWSGIASALKNQTLGLIWLDAHMDAHTPEDSMSGNIHGMPVATLMGEGYPELINILGAYPKLSPQNIILIGIRSYEDAEKERLERLGVKIYYTEEVNRRGFIHVFQEAWAELGKKVDKIGLSIDLDGFDPKFAPGVGTAEPDGIDYPDCITALSNIDKSMLCGLEITEGNDHFDPSGKTMQCIVDLIQLVSN
jgi:arginase